MITTVAGHNTNDVITTMVPRMIKTMTQTSKICLGRGSCVGITSATASILFPVGKKKMVFTEQDTKQRQSLQSLSHFALKKKKFGKAGYKYASSSSSSRLEIKQIGWSLRNGRIEHARSFALLLPSHLGKLF